MTRHDVRARLSHQHYQLQAFILAIPLALIAASAEPLVNFQAVPWPKAVQQLDSSWASWALMLALVGAVYSASSLESACWRTAVVLRLLVVLHYSLSASLGLGERIVYCLLFLVAYTAATLYAPFPGYLGPTQVSSLLLESDYDELVAIVPPAQKLDLSTPNPSLVPARNMREDAEEYSKRRAASAGKHAVLLFTRADDRACKELEIVHHRLSLRYTSPSLSFYQMSMEDAPQVAYDLELSASTANNDFPTLFLFHKGGIVKRLPMIQDEADVESTHPGALSRRRWSRTARSIVDVFELDKLSQFSRSDEKSDAKKEAL